MPPQRCSAPAPRSRKLLLGHTTPWLLAGLLYTASGLTLSLWRIARRSPRVLIPPAEVAPLAGAVLFGGVLAPVLLMLGLVAMPGSGASLLLNAEALFTALVAWLVFREATSRRIVIGFALIAAGAAVLGWPGQPQFAGTGPTLAVLGACLCWGIDNNLTRAVARNDPVWLAAVKGAVAGPVNLALAFLLGAQLPDAPAVGGAAAVGVLSYRVSLVLFIFALASLGSARAGAYFAVAPFFGAILALASYEPFTWTLAAPQHSWELASRFTSPNTTTMSTPTPLSPTTTGTATTTDTTATHTTLPSRRLSATATNTRIRRSNTPTRITPTPTTGTTTHT